MAYLELLSGEAPCITVPLAGACAITLDSRPMPFTSPVTTALPDTMEDDAEETDDSTLKQRRRLPPRSCRRKNTRRNFLPMGRAGYWPICSSGSRSHFQFAGKRGRQPEFIERKLPELVPRPTPPAPPIAAPAKQSKTSAAAQAALPLFDAPADNSTDKPADQPKEAFVWDETKGIE